MDRRTAGGERGINWDEKGGLNLESAQGLVWKERLAEGKWVFEAGVGEVKIDSVDTSPPVKLNQRACSSGYLSASVCKEIRHRV